MNIRNNNYLSQNGQANQNNNNHNNNTAFNNNLKLIPSPKNISYFDIYRIDYDIIKKEAIIKIENNFIQGLNEIILPPHEPSEIIPLLPPHINFAKLCDIAREKKQESLWNTLRLIFDDEVLKHDKMWQNKNKAIILTWNNVQENLVKQLSYRKTSPVSESKRSPSTTEDTKFLTADQIEHLPGLLEEFSYMQLLDQKQAVESELEKQCKDLVDSYKRDLKQFLEKDWYPFRKYYFTFELTTENRRNAIVDEKNGELLALNQQFLTAEKWLKQHTQTQIQNQSRHREKERKIKISVVYGSNNNYSIDDHEIITDKIMNMSVHEWIEDLFQTKFGNIRDEVNINQLHAIIPKHGKMIDHNLMKTYNFDAIDTIILKIINGNSNNNSNSNGNSNINIDNLINSNSNTIDIAESNVSSSSSSPPLNPMITSSISTSSGVTIQPSIENIQSQMNGNGNGNGNGNLNESMNTNINAASIPNANAYVNINGNGNLNGNEKTMLPSQSPPQSRSPSPSLSLSPSHSRSISPSTSIPLLFGTNFSNQNDPELDSQ